MFKIQQLKTMVENQTFDRKSIKIEPKALAIPMIAFANADGGVIVVGISNDGEIEGINGYEQKVNELLRVPFDFCVPSLKVDFRYITCKDSKGITNRVLYISVEQSIKVHANQADEVFYRVGDKSKKLSFEERMQLMYDKGDMIYEDTFVRDAGVADLDMEFVTQYAKLISYKKSSMQFLEEGLKVIKKEKGKYGISAAAILLFGKDPQRFFPRARIRFIKYEGTEEKTGTQMNIIKDITFEGTILQMLQKAIEFVGTQIKEYTRLAEGGLFSTTQEYPEFAWKETIVNSVAHRDYSIKGTDIHIKMFQDKIVVESPGTLPGLVRLNNLRTVHFSRNPKIAGFLKDYEYVKEFGEGIDRIYVEMEAVGLPQPEYSVIAFMTKVVIKNRTIEDMASKVKETSSNHFNYITDCITDNITDNITETQRLILLNMAKDTVITQQKLSEIIGISKRNIIVNINKLREMGLVERVGSDRKGSWHISKKAVAILKCKKH